MGIWPRYGDAGPADTVSPGIHPPLPLPSREGMFFKAGTIRRRVEYAPVARQDMCLVDDFEMVLDLFIAGDHLTGRSHPRARAAAA